MGRLRSPHYLGGTRRGWGERVVVSYGTGRVGGAYGEFAERALETVGHVTRAGLVGSELEDE